MLHTFSPQPIIDTDIFGIAIEGDESGYTPLWDHSSHNNPTHRHKGNDEGKSIGGVDVPARHGWLLQLESDASWRVPVPGRTDKVRQKAEAGQNRGKHCDYTVSFFKCTKLLKITLLYKFIQMAPLVLNLTVPRADLAMGIPPCISIHHSVVDPISAVPEKQCSHFISKQSGNDLVAELAVRVCV